MKLEAGKRYVARNGWVTDPIQEQSTNMEYPYHSTVNGFVQTWTEDGRFFSDGEPSPHDLIEEYVEGEKQMKLEVGKRYVTRDGRITDKVEKHPTSELYPFQARVNGKLLRWHGNGSYQIMNEDLVQELENVVCCSGNLPVKSKKFFIIGHGQHGKDTLADIMKKDLGLSFISSSLFSCRRVILPYALQNPDTPTGQSIRGQTESDAVDILMRYKNENRTLWKKLISEYNWPNLGRLGTEIFEEHDVYVGIRSLLEYRGLIETLSDKYDFTTIMIFNYNKGKDSTFTIPMHEADVVIENPGDYQGLLENYIQVRTKFKWK